MELVPPAESGRRIAHRLPCTISHRGTATAAYVPETGLRSFRGRKLERGGFVVPETHEMYAAESEEGTDTWTLKYELEKEGVFYLHDDIPKHDSPLPKALQWLQLSAALHAPIDHAQMQAKGDENHKAKVQDTNDNSG